jgi:hypothetical protein
VSPKQLQPWAQVNHILVFKITHQVDINFPVGMLNTKKCCFDHTDCANKVIMICPTCPYNDDVDYYVILPEVRDRICHAHLNTEKCCFDGGDCVPEILNACPSCPNIGVISGFRFQQDKRNIGDMICDLNMKYEECCFDGGDCDLNNGVLKICPTCNDNAVLHRLGNDVCDETLYHTDCCFDAGDCPKSTLDCPHCFDLTSGWLRDGMCDETLNNKDCCFDGGDCGCSTCPVVFDREAYSGRYTPALANGYCDWLLQGVDCCYDGGDCIRVSRYKTNKFQLL